MARSGFKAWGPVELTRTWCSAPAEAGWKHCDTAGEGRLRYGRRGACALGIEALGFD